MAIKALRSREYHKLIIGAALKDFKTIEEYAYLFTHAGAHVIDLSAFPHSVISARRGLDKARKEDTSLAEPIIMVSINIGKDPHFRRIELNTNNCTECELCIPSCPSQAFSLNHKNHFSYNIDLCFGCSNCLDYCHFDALSFSNWSSFDPESLLELISLGAGAFEIHLNHDLNAFIDFYNSLPRLPDDFLQSFSIGSEMMNADDLREATQTITELVHSRYGRDKDLIIQTDGIPISGARELRSEEGSLIEKDMQSILNAEVVLEELKKLEVQNTYVQLAGGITEHSFAKAYKHGVEVNGVAIGSYARKKLQELPEREAIKTAKKLIQLRTNP